MFSTVPFKSIYELMNAFPTEESCIIHLENLRWEGKVISPFDEDSKVYVRPNHKYMCKNTNKYFNVLQGTIFEGTKLPLRQWFMAIYLFTTHKKGISSHQLAKDLSVTQKTAWFVLSRLRYAFEHKTFLDHMKETELWKEIPGYEGLYAVSTFGNIKSLEKNVVIRDVYSGVRKEAPISPAIRTGYYIVGLTDSKGDRDTLSLHRLVAQTFIDNPENKRTVNHIDGNKLNNRVDNLEWATDKENIKHAFDTGLKTNPSGSSHPNSKPVLQIDRSGNIVKEWENAAQTKEEGFTRQSVEMCCKGKISQHKGYRWMYKSSLSEKDESFIAFMEGTVQVDETFVGGKNKNRHKDKKVPYSQGRACIDKTPILGMLQEERAEYVERPHKVIPERTVKEKVVTQAAKLECVVTKDTSEDSILPEIKKVVKDGATVVSDEWKAYNKLGQNYVHQIVDHARSQYVNTGGFTTNAMEGAWSHLKRTIIGTYHQVSRKHLQKYANEFSFRYNTKREATDSRFHTFLNGTKGKRITYKTLIQK